MKKNFFKDKKITMMGLGLLGRGINVAKFLLDHGAELTITDLKDGEKLKSSLEELKKYEAKITYVLGEHRLRDFENCDMVIKSAGVPLNSEFIAHAKKNGVPVEMDASLFAGLVSKGVTLIGITGTRGKSTTTHLIYHLLKQSGKTVYLGGNVRGLATLPLLDVVKSGDYVVLELDSWQLQGFGEAQISPKVAVFTNLMPDHMNYYKDDMEAYFKDKANIFLNQKEGDLLVVGEQVSERVLTGYKSLKAKVLNVGSEDFPKSWNFKLLGEHNRYNGALAITVARELGLDEDVIRKGIESFTEVEGRLEFVGKVKGVEVYNDNNATTPEATVAGLEALSHKGKVVLIVGGTDKGLDVKALVEAIKEYCRVVVFLTGTGTEKLKEATKHLSEVKFMEGERLEEVVEMALEEVRQGEVILLSPAFASFSKYFENEYERNDLFKKIIGKKLD